MYMDSISAESGNVTVIQETNAICLRNEEEFWVNAIFLTKVKKKKFARQESMLKP